MVRNNPPIMGALQKNILEHISLMAMEQIQVEFSQEMMHDAAITTTSAYESTGCTTVTTDTLKRWKQEKRFLLLK